ncbi:helix-turn-helix transcriptional regulator [Ancylobacter sp. A5.8]|uniref:helix-turn-helix domain-containing protein n=1 Tax=Ancylobacter gelatini TaxID=2919920 RepID=UPI001F4EBF76|nr:helix-turn-helix transcriptional regulator [Ancylobacter gelatini]MCJ8142934.1 helix-turn-helix transcriptional regulator [Ancylobacter gelatini]
MPVKTYPQLDDRCLALLREALERYGTRDAVAEQLGVSRTAVSQALNGRYPADVRRLAAKIVERFADHIACPHLAREIRSAECVELRERPLTPTSREAVKQWQACRACPLNPNKSEIRNVG